MESNTDKGSHTVSMQSAGYTRERPITEKQLSFVRSLLRERQLKHIEGGESIEQLEARAEGLTSKQASGWIDRLMDLPKIEANTQFSPRAAEAKVVDAGKYALVTDGTADFYEVEYGKPGGKWEGFCFLSRLSGENHEPIKDRQQKKAILTRIADDPEGALRLYGTLTNSCGCCGMKLTDKFSRFYGIGPVCRKKRGLPISAADYVKRGGTLPANYHDEGSDQLPLPAEDEATPTRRVVRVAEGEAVDLNSGRRILPTVERVELEAADAPTYEAAMELIRDSRSLSEREKGKVARNEADRRKAREYAELEVAKDERFAGASQASIDDRINRLTEKFHLQIRESREA